MKKDGENRRITSSKDMPVKRVEAIKQRSHERRLEAAEQKERKADEDFNELAASVTERRDRHEAYGFYRSETYRPSEAVELGEFIASISNFVHGVREYAESKKQRNSERVEKGFDELEASDLKRHANSVQGGNLAKLVKQRQKSSDSVSSISSDSKGRS